jgi:hypothetical protein
MSPNLMFLAPLDVSSSTHLPSRTFLSFAAFRLSTPQVETSVDSRTSSSSPTDYLRPDDWCHRLEPGTKIQIESPVGATSERIVIDLLSKSCNSNWLHWGGERTILDLGCPSRRTPIDPLSIGRQYHFHFHSFLYEKKNNSMPNEERQSNARFKTTSVTLLESADDC